MKVDEEYSAYDKKNLNPVNEYKLRSKPTDKMIKTFDKKMGEAQKEISRGVDRRINRHKNT